MKFWNIFKNSNTVKPIDKQDLYQNKQLDYKVATLNSFRSGVLESLAPENPSNRSLTSVYNKFMTTPPVAIERKRINSEISKGQFQSTTPKVQEEVIQSHWWDTFINIIIDSEFYGVGLIYFTFNEDGSIKGCHSYDRHRLISRDMSIQRVDNGVYSNNYIPINKELDYDGLNNENIILLRDDDGLGLFNTLAMPILMYDSLMNSSMFFNETRRNPIIHINATANMEDADKSVLINQLKSSKQKTYLLTSDAVEVKVLDLKGGNRSGLDTDTMSEIKGNIQKIINGVSFGENTQVGSNSRESTFADYVHTYQRFRINKILRIANEYLPLIININNYKITYDYNSDTTSD